MASVFLKLVSGLWSKVKLKRSCSKVGALRFTWYKWVIRWKVQTHVMRSSVLSIQLNAGYVRAKHVQFHQNLEIRIAGSSGRVQNASPRKEPFLLAPRLWRPFARRIFCDSATEIPCWWSKICPESGQALIGRRSSYIVLAIVYEWQTKG